MNLYLVQLIGVVTTLLGLAMLTLTADLFGQPLTRTEKRRAGMNEHRNTNRLPFRWETLGAAAIFLLGLGILAWTKFDSCGFALYWMPSLGSFLRVTMNCR